MGLVAPDVVVRTPPTVPAFLGLLASITPVPEPERAPGVEGWEAGFIFLPENCDGGGSLVPCAEAVRVEHDPVDPVEYQPFEVEGAFTCTSRGWTENDYDGRARRQLDASASAQLAAELWLGTMAQAEGWPNPYLMQSPVLVAAGDATALVRALALLVRDGMQCNDGNRGVVHLTVDAAYLAWTAGALWRDASGRVFDAFGNLYVADAGYPGTGPPVTSGGDPDPADDEHSWAYFTNAVDVRLGPVQLTPSTFAEALDRRTNTVEYFAQRTVSAVFDGCCLFAVNLDLTALCG